MKTRRPTIFAVLVLLAVALLLGWRAGSNTGLEQAEPVFAKATISPERDSKVMAPLSLRPHEKALAQAHTVTASALIESLRYEPEAPCVGDDVVIETVLRPSAAEAKVFVNGQHGTLQVVRARQAGMQRVRVLVRSWGDTYERRDVMVEVRDCGDEPRVRAQIRAQVIAEREYMLKLSPAPAGPVRWEFGDGAAESSVPRTAHRYASRTDRPQSSYLVTATYDGPSGEEVARLTVSHAEPLGIAARTPFPLLESEGERFVTWDRERGLRTSRRVSNSLDRPLDLAQAELRAFPCDGSPVEVRTLPARALLDRTHLAAHESADLALKVPGATFAEPICQLLVRLSGDAGGRVATTTMALDTGVPHRTLPLDDEMHEVMREIVAQRGHHGPITAEEIERFRFASGT